MFISNEESIAYFQECFDKPANKVNLQNLNDILTNVKKSITDLKTTDIRSHLIPSGYKIFQTYGFQNNFQIDGYTLSNQNISIKSVYEFLERFIFINLKNFLTPSLSEGLTFNKELKVVGSKLSDISITCIKLATLEKSNVNEYFLGVSENRNLFSSSGCAIHASAALATHNAIYETLENHIITEHIINNLRPVEIELPAEYFETRDFLEGKGFSIKVLCFNKLSWPVFQTHIYHSKGQDPYLFYGLGCNQDHQVALGKSIDEALMCFIIEHDFAENKCKKVRSEDVPNYSTSKNYYFSKTENLRRNWHTANKVSLNKIETKFQIDDLLEFIGELDYYILPLVFKQKDLFWVKAFSPKIAPKVFEKVPYCRIKDSASLDKLIGEYTL